jgi:hypothetical protein
MQQMGGSKGARRAVPIENGRAEAIAGNCLLRPGLRPERNAPGAECHTGAIEPTI